MIGDLFAWLWRAIVVIVIAVVAWGVLRWVADHPQRAASNVETAVDSGADVGGGIAEFFSNLVDGEPEKPAPTK